MENWKNTKADCKEQYNMVNKINIPPQEKTISDLWRIAQNKNCDDFIKMVKELNIKIVYNEKR